MQLLARREASLENFGATEAGRSDVGIGRQSDHAERDILYWVFTDI